MTNNLYSLPSAVGAMLVLLLCGCGRELANVPPRNTIICCFGDSLVSGVGAKEAESYPAHLAQITGRPVQAWGTSGDTTSDGVAKLARFAGSEFGIVIVTLGGNDILQRKPWDETRANLETIFQTLIDSGAVVVFTGITGPLNPTRNREYGKLCKAYGVLYIPEILDGIRNRDELMSDAIHPNADGYRRMAERIARELQQAGLLGV